MLLAGGMAVAVGGAVALPTFAADNSPSLVQVTSATDGTPVPGRYIVTLKSGASTATTAQSLKAADVKRFDGVLNGFAAKLTGDQLQKLRRDKRVAAIEQDQIVRASTTQKAPLPWGLDRIDQRGQKLSKSYTYTATGKGVTAYVIDSGIQAGHPEFGGRAAVAWYASRYANGSDCNGHGTHVAGIIGSKSYGAAKGVKIRALKALDCDGSGYLSDIVAAANWVRANAAKPAVANLSLGGSKSASLNTAVTNLSKSGVFVTVAAGNDNIDACKTSPASAGWVMAVGATTVYDNRAAFSNWGKCVDISAPGYGIWSTWPGSTKNKISGTSMAAPYVTGVAALILQKYPKATFPSVQKWLNDNSTKNALKKLRGGTANRMVYKAKL